MPPAIAFEQQAQIIKRLDRLAELVLDTARAPDQAITERLDRLTGLLQALGDRLSEPRQAPVASDNGHPACKHCGQAATLISWVERDSGKQVAAWKCEACKKWLPLKRITV